MPGATATFPVRFTTAGTKALRSTRPSRRKLTPVVGSIRVLVDGRTTTMISHLGLTLIGKFASPTFVVAPPDDPSRLLVVQQNGLVSLIENGVLQTEPFLDLRSVVHADGEKGLLSIAFAPDYATSGLLYAYFNNRDGNIRLLEYHRSATNPDRRSFAAPGVARARQADGRPQRRHDAIRPRRLPLHRHRRRRRQPADDPGRGDRARR